MIMLFYVMCGFVLCLFIIMWLIWDNVRLSNRVGEMEEKIYKRLQNIENILFTLEHRTSFYVPKNTPVSRPLYLGYSTNDNDYISIRRVIDMLLKRLNVTIRRADPMPEEILLTEKRKK